MRIIALHMKMINFVIEITVGQGWGACSMRARERGKWFVLAGQMGDKQGSRGAFAGLQAAQRAALLLLLAVLPATRAPL